MIAKAQIVLRVNPWSTSSTALLQALSCRLSSARQKETGRRPCQQERHRQYRPARLHL